MFSGRFWPEQRFGNSGFWANKLACLLAKAYNFYLSICLEGLGFRVQGLGRHAKP